MSSSRVRDSSCMRVFVPAISEPYSPVSGVRLFELNERVFVFDDLDHLRMKELPTRKIVSLDGQERLF